MRLDLRVSYMLMLVLLTLTLMKGHSGSVSANNHRCMLSATKQAKSIKLDTEVGHFYVTLTLTLQTFTWLNHLGIVLRIKRKVDILN